MTNKTISTQQPQNELIKIQEVMEITTFSRNTIYKLMGNGEFPRLSKVGRGSYWKRREIEQWINDLTPATDEQVQEAAEQAAKAARKKVH
ncbi:AlpA family phage regulatory protein [Marinomonas sp. M1K-6]|uniref:AlpA family phage regulatory protein n=1 Tax=Marinomonas profundi TaxID=2726122 RepID=A0A847QWB3_9GAMM|nr:AlpA family phage regulatory protein [Marinomonas profundi]NLQ17588.1 AlpA family phage regulatory protein [Marinomonas profundi]UDV02196.1 AlpA family phage regulatory protein [Marinomonas profundi]